MKELIELYENETTFGDQMVLDLEDGAAWFNIEEFGKLHDIDGKKVLSIFVGDRRGQSIEIRADTNKTPEGIVKARGLLFIRADEIEGVRADQALRLDGRLYTVADARILQDRVWRIVLEANES
ncbi:MAG: hypothetical protein LBS53_06280 [Synergistaceae bacterium]|jgi:hypothetical protein|nr:hypothetical protein [Synergistaceae bacterium]